ncbi:glycosyltransferase involved in cell wall biosynthesis [Mycobacterium sp. OAS707]|uniref:glycosyltransferase n=1 Tax=unclassified Mycobacterium TaxID=2642494 RepID=UPI001789F144|nr:glycosyltransferase [Mycobacterium sp. OAS707]MBE1547484.1 glycosyltransferase involved in cell wall biosynthesis [Mycobacterium sp. OAS707]
MPRATFLLSKDPVTERAGDVELGRLMMQLASDAYDVSAVCLSSEVGPAELPGGIAVTRIPKPKVQPVQLLADAVRKRRSLVHVRFDTAPLVAAIDAADSDVFVAEHSYMAESFLRSNKFRSARLIVNTNVSEALVWRASRGALGRLEAPRLRRDEVRVARAADAVGTYDEPEAEFYRANGVPRARWLDLTLPPVEPVNVSTSPRRLVFMGLRDWPPNQEAFLYALRLWPRIAAGIPDAELCVIGKKKPGAADPVYPEGVRDLGFVDDLGEFLGTCRALVAPIKTGGGVRVKILDSLRMGLPVVGTSAAVGDLGSLFGLQTFDDDDGFVDECRRYLLDKQAAVEAAGRLYEINKRRWEERRPHRAVEALLRAEAVAA